MMMICLARDELEGLPVARLLIHRILILKRALALGAPFLRARQGASSGCRRVKLLVL